MNEIFHKTWLPPEHIKTLLIDQSEAFWNFDLGIQRDRLDALLKSVTAPHVVIISGLRRVGKSILLAQLAHRLGRENFYYINFEDDRFTGFTSGDFNTLFAYLVELFGERHTFLIDEIQNIPGWEAYVRRFMDLGYKFFITGSNASMLSQDLGTRLTGRTIPVELFPFSFHEYLLFRHSAIPDASRLTTTEGARLQSWLSDYLDQGGIPQTLQYPDLDLHQILFNDVLYRDIVARYKISEVKAIKELALMLISNPAGLISYNKFKTMLGLGSVNTVKNFIEYMAQSWLIFTTNVYDSSIKRQQIASKKIYSIDTGLIRSVGLSFSQNTGKLWENLVFLMLRQKTSEIYYWASVKGHEVDFFLPRNDLLIQVCMDLTSEGTRERELRALQEAMKALDIPSAQIISRENEEPIQTESGKVEICSLAGWLLSDTLNQST